MDQNTQNNQFVNQSSASNAGTPPMDTNPMTNAQSTPMTMPAEHKKVGPIVATLVIVIALIVAALYFFASYMNKQPTPVMQQSVDTTQSADTTSMSAAATTSSVPQVTNSSDDLDSIQADLNMSTQGVSEQSF